MGFFPLLISRRAFPCTRVHTPIKRRSALHYFPQTVGLSVRLRKHHLSDQVIACRIINDVIIYFFGVSKSLTGDVMPSCIGFPYMVNNIYIFLLKQRFPLSIVDIM